MLAAQKLVIAYWEGKRIRGREVTHTDCHLANQVTRRYLRERPTLVLATGRPSRFSPRVRASFDKLMRAVEQAARPENGIERSTRA